MIVGPHRRRCDDGNHPLIIALVAVGSSLMDVVGGDILVLFSARAFRAVHALHRMVGPRDRLEGLLGTESANDSSATGRRRNGTSTMAFRRAYSPGPSAQSAVGGGNE
jgi:hypothetical protein